MTDYGSQYADRRQKIIEWRLLKVYREAQKELQAKTDSFVRRTLKEERAKQKQVAAGIITEQEYKDWRIGREFAGKQWDSKVRMMTDTLFHYNERALDVIREEQFNVFAQNANFQAFNFEKDAKGGISFDIYDETTVERLIREKPELLPPKKVNGKKDRAWNQGIIANSVTQGILQGEGIPDIAKRIARDTASRNNKSMTRYARTAMTAAQNAGRLETMHRSKGMGIKVKKTWIATLDNRTRDAHAELDGETVDIDEPFVNEIGEIDYPGDPDADSENVWNCRCTLGYEYPEYEDMEEQVNNLRYDQEYDEEIENMSYEDWAEWRKQQIKERFKDADSPYITEDVESEYTDKNTPGEGEIERQNNYRSQNWRHEDSVAEALINKYGGDVLIYDEKGNDTVPDFLWSNKQWEVKQSSSLNSADTQTKRAIHQSAKYNGNIIIDYISENINEAVEAILHRIERSAWRELDIIIMHNQQVKVFVRNKKQ